MQNSNQLAATNLLILAMSSPTAIVLAISNYLQFINQIHNVEYNQISNKLSPPLPPAGALLNRRATRSMGRQALILFESFCRSSLNTAEVACFGEYTHGER